MCHGAALLQAKKRTPNYRTFVASPRACHPLRSRAKPAETGPRDRPSRLLRASHRTGSPGVHLHDSRARQRCSPFSHTRFQPSSPRPGCQTTDRNQRASRKPHSGYLGLRAWTFAMSEAPCFARRTTLWLTDPAPVMPDLQMRCDRAIRCSQSISPSLGPPALLDRFQYPFLSSG